MKTPVVNLPSEERLLVLANLAQPNSLESAEIRALAALSELDWEIVFQLAEINAASPLTLHRLEAEGCLNQIPSGLRERWKAQIAPIQTRGEKRVQWAGKLLKAMNEEGIDVIVLKGSLFADTLYLNPTYKKMNDVDVMIRRKDAKRATAILRDLGFQGVGDLFGKEELSANSHHTPPYVSHDLGCVVGLHWGLVSPLSPWRPDTLGIWKRKIPVQVAGAAAFRMSWEDNLLHLCIHLPFFKTGLRELADVFNLVRSCEPKLDWEVVSRRARSWRAEDPLYRVLKLSNALVELHVPLKLWRRAATQTSRFSLEDTAQRLLQPESLLRSRSTQAAKIEKAYAIFKLSGKYSERAQAWAGMWAFMLWPNEVELNKISGPNIRPKSSWATQVVKRVKAPARLWNAMARDHGHLPLAAMTLLNAGILARATLNQVVHPERDGRSLREHPAAKLLEVLE